MSTFKLQFAIKLKQWNKFLINIKFKRTNCLRVNTSGYNAENELLE
jgi:hypothetical protein